MYIGGEVMNEKVEKEKILLLLDPETVKRIENYWHEKGFKSRTEAIRNLIDIALEKEQQD